MKKHARFLTTLLAAVLLVAAALPSAFAANAYTPIKGGKFNFNKELTIKDGANVPNVTFGFTITPGESAGATENRIAISAGPEGAKIGNATFTPTDSATDGKATKQVAVDLTGVTFTEPGIYRYVITESDTNVLGVSNDSKTTRYLDVYVIDKDGKLEIPEGGYVLHTGIDDAIDQGEQSNKSAGFTNTYDTINLTFSKEVSGNQGSRDKYFAITVKTTNLSDGDEFNVSGSFDKTPTKTDATTYSDFSSNNVTKLTGAQLNAGYTFYLQHNQNVVIQGLPKGANYTVTEKKEDYTPSVTANEGTIAGTKDSVVVESASKDNTVAFTNTRNGVIPTGVLLTVAPFAAIMAIGAVGIIVMVGKKRKRAE